MTVSESVGGGVDVVVLLINDMNVGSAGLQTASCSCTSVIIKHRAGTSPQTGVRTEKF